jgi:hypothetical protein
MVIKEITYSKEYTSVTSQEDVSHHGSPILEDVQENCPEDIRIRKEVEEKFSLFHRGEFNSPIHYGFDGTQQYVFDISGKPSNFFCSQNERYATKIEIKKTGAEERIEKLCDLEMFLLKNKFESVKSKKQCAITP